MAYLLVLLVMVLFGVLEFFIPRAKSIWVFYILVLGLVTFAGARQSGPDFFNYKDLFESNSSFGAYTGEQLIEPGFAALLMLNKVGSLNLFLTAVAAIAVTLNAVFIFRNSPYLICSLIVYYSTTYFVKELGQIRHGLAMGVALLSFQALFEGKARRFLIWTLVASCFHYTAMCLLPLYFFYKKKVRAWIYVGGVIILSPFLFIGLKDLIYGSAHLLPLAALEAKVVGYEISGDQFMQPLGINSSLLLRIVVLGILLGFREKLRRKYPRVDIIINIYFMGLVYFMLFNSLSEFAHRLSVYFRVLEIIIFPMCFSIFREWIAKVCLYMLICINAYLSIAKILSQPGVMEQYYSRKSTIGNDTVGTSTAYGKNCHEGRGDV